MEKEQPKTLDEDKYQKPVVDTEEDASIPQEHSNSKLYSSASQVLDSSSQLGHLIEVK